MMDLLLHMNRCGEVADGDPKSPKAANYDEPKANRYAKLPDPLLLNDVKTVTTAKMCWEKRRPEIVHVFRARGLWPRAHERAQTELGGSLGNERGEWQWSNHYEEVGGTRRPLRISLCDRGHRPDSQDASQCERSGAGEDGIRLEPRVFSVSGPALSEDECVAPGTHMAVAGSRQRLGYAIYIPPKCAGGQGRRINAGRERW